MSRSSALLDRSAQLPSLPYWIFPVFPGQFKELSPVFKVVSTVVEHSHRMVECIMVSGAEMRQYVFDCAVFG